MSEPLPSAKIPSDVSGTSGSPSPALMRTIEQQTGWKRPNPHFVCQDWTVLERVTHFCYELTEDFVAYCAGRGFCDLRQCDCGFEKANEGYPMSAKEVYAATAKPAQRFQRCTQQRLQDLWELFTTNHGGIAIR